MLNRFSLLFTYVIMLAIVSEFRAQDSLVIKVCDGEFPYSLMHSGSTGSSFLWSNGDTTALIQIDSSGIYSVTVLQENGDSSITNYDVVDWGRPSLDWTESHSGSTYFFSAVGNFMDSLTTIDWMIDSSSYSGESVSHTFPWLNSASAFSLYISAENQCGVAELFDEICVGSPLGEEPCYPVGLKTVTDKFMEIYPNPTSGQLFFELTETEIRRVHIVSCHGNIVERFDNPSSSVDLSHLVNGLYWLEMQTRNGVIVRKQFLLSK